MRSHAYDEMDDDDLFGVAKRTLDAAQAAPQGSLKRAGLITAYEELAKELRRRMANRVARELGFPEEP